MKAVDRVRRAARSRAQRLGSRLGTAVERPAAARALAPLIGVGVTFRKRTPCRLSWDGAWVHRYRTGVVVWPTVGAPTPRELLDRSVEVNLFGMRLDAGDVVVDVGSGIGQEAMPWARVIGPTGRLVAIEAHPGTFRLLQQNLTRNRLGNVIAVNTAITDRPGISHISGEVGELSSRIGNLGVEIQATTLDDLLGTLEIDRIAFLKMNIEGAERDAIRGMDVTLARTANVCIACHDFLVEVARDPTLATKTLVTEFLISRGFDVTSRADDSRPWVRDRVYGSRNPR